MTPAESARLLLALDACGVTAGVVERAVAMAAGLDGELAALFVEDDALRRAAALPFASEIRLSGREQRFDPDALLAASRRAAEEAARLIEQHAAARRVRWSFASAAGVRLLAALAAGEDADLLVPARSTGAAGRSPFRRVCLLLEQPARTERALRLVRALAADGHTRELHVYGGRGLSRGDLRVARLPALDLRFEQADTSDPLRLLRAMSAASAGGLVMLPRELLVPAPGVPAEALDHLSGSLLLLR